MDERAETDIAIRKFFAKITFNFKWWQRRMYMRLLLKEETVKLKLTDVEMTPGDVWRTPQGNHLIYMGKDWFAYYREMDE